MKSSLPSVLSEFTGDIQRYCDVISRMLDIDVYIVDNTYNTVACSLIYHYNLIGPNIEHHAGLFAEALAMAPTIDILHTSTAASCQHCIYRKSCNIRFQISVPIYTDTGELLGLIGLIGLTEEQEHFVQSKRELVFNFLRQLSELIASKGMLFMDYQKQSDFLAQLSFVLNRVDEGVIIFDQHARVIQSNEGTSQILGLKDDLALHQTKINLEAVGAPSDSVVNYHLTVNGKTYDITGTIFEIPMNHNRLLVFQDTNAMQLNVMKSASTNDVISLQNIEGKSKPILKIKKTIRSIASSQSNVLVTGESGTGKELVARAIHDLSDRSDQPFVAINCAAIPDSLLESELFGYAGGAFTGANQKGRIGKFELANKGTLFLDEIGDMPLFIQAKILRVLENRVVVRVGDNREIKVDLRIIAATNKNLESMVEKQTFREDLFYRLNVIPIHLPALRERPGDISVLASIFLREYATKFKRTVHSIDKDFFQAIEGYSWPGNIRELRNVMEYVVNMMDDDGRITAELLEGRLRTTSKPHTYNLEQNERMMIQSALQDLVPLGYSHEAIAKELGISVATFYRKIKQI